MKKEFPGLSETESSTTTPQEDGGTVTVTNHKDGSVTITITAPDTHYYWAVVDGNVVEVWAPKTDGSTSTTTTHVSADGNTHVTTVAIKDGSGKLIKSTTTIIIVHKDGSQTITEIDDTTGKFSSLWLAHPPIVNPGSPGVA